MIKRVRARNGDEGDVQGYDSDDYGDYLLVAWSDHTQSWVNAEDVEVVK